MSIGETPAGDILVPLQTEEKDLTPYPAIEYDVLFHTSLDKLIRDVNKKMEQGRQTEGGIQVVTSGASTRFYQAMIRRNVDAEPQSVPDLVDIDGEDETEN